MSVDFEINEVTRRLPKHLHKFIVKQPYDQYTYQNQAVWRYVMKVNIDFLGKVAHSSYLDGLKKTGISYEHIPKMEGMNRILKDIGWAAVAVDGFIPPNAFMEFQSYNVLVIASDIRTLENIEYTPAPDIIHEAAGHAPIIANPEYSEYLRMFGVLGSKAISSKNDYQMYEAIRWLSILKENPNSDPKEVRNAKEKVLELQNQITELSEMSMIRNLHWWTVEYGLIGTLKDYKIYGAGLLSSIGESISCMDDKKVQKKPFDISASRVSFDITQPQPQLFVTPSFANLNFVLEEFAKQMALRTGGLKGVKKLIESENLGTAELNTGIQISGVFSEMILEDSQKRILYLQTKGPTSLSYKDKEMVGHGSGYHIHGYGTPIGKLKGFNDSLENMSCDDLKILGILEGEKANIEFEGGVIVSGNVITVTRDRMGKILMISFENCNVNYGNKILFEPSWGVFDMIIGTSVISVFSGPADPDSFDDVVDVPKTKSRKIKYSSEELELHCLYGQLRKIREENKLNMDKLIEFIDLTLEKFPNEWLLLLEIYELLPYGDNRLKQKIQKQLNHLKCQTKYRGLIQNGLRLFNN